MAGCSGLGVFLRSNNSAMWLFRGKGNQTRVAWAVYSLYPDNTAKQKETSDKQHSRGSRAALASLL